MPIHQHDMQENEIESSNNFMLLRMNRVGQTIWRRKNIIRNNGTVE